MSTPYNATDLFNIEDADIEIIPLKEYETPSFMIGTTALRPLEFVFDSVHYEEVLDKLRNAIKGAIHHCQETVGKDRLNVRVTHRQDQLIKAVEDKYIGVFSVCAYQKLEDVSSTQEMDFSDALRKLKDGHAIYRAEWGNDCFVQYIPESLRSKMTGIHLGKMIAHCFTFVDDQGIAQLGWTPTIEDMFATDWCFK